jgi:hypothetical protein
VLLLCLLAFGLSASLAVQPLKAQVLYGTVVGTVTDQSGAVVPGAHITLTNPLTGLKREVDSDAAGMYAVPNLPEGAYDLTATATGFGPLTQKGVQVTIGAIVRVDLTLQVGPVTQEVTVSATAAVLQTEKSDVSTRLSTVATQNLPLGFYRNYQYLMLLAPGAAEDQGTTGALADTPERAIAVPMNGLSPASNSTRIDGAQSTFLWKPGGGALYVAPLESVQEIKITTNSFDPEKGMAGSAAVDVITKSGTNDLHGVGFWYHTDHHLMSCEAFNYECKSKAAYGRESNKPKQILNNFGGNLGGPIKKDKLFFFANWDGIFERRMGDFYGTVPTEDLHRGDFREYLENPVFLADGVTPVMVNTTDGLGNITGTTQLYQGMIFDPTTGNADGTGRAVFAYGGVINVLPESRIVDTAKTILGLWPTGNVPPQYDEEGNAILNQFVQAPIRFDRNNYDFKVDWNRTDKHLAWFKYSAMRAVTDANCAYNDVFSPPCPGGEAGITHALNQVMTVGHTWTLSPTFLVDGSLGYSRMGQDSYGVGYGKNIGLEVLGIPGTNDPTDERYSGAPSFSVGGYTALQGAEGWQPLFRNDWSLTFSQNASWTRGKHTMRFGFDFIHHHLNHWQPESVNPRGTFSFDTGDATMLNLGGLDTNVDLYRNRYNQFASFLLGIWDSGGRSLQYQKMNGKSSEFAFYFSDRWRVTPKLTANIGFRYEYYPLMGRDALGKGLEQYDPNTNKVLLGGLGGNPKNLGVTTEKGLLAPRIGLAYQVTPNTVFRAGYASTFDTFPILRLLRGTFPYDIGMNFTYDFSDPNLNTLAACQDTSNGNVDCTYQGMGTLADGLPAIPVPDLSSGVVDIAPTVGVRFVGPGTLKRGRVETWNTTVERRLGDFILGVGYVGNHMVHGWAQQDYHASRIDEQSPLAAKWGRTAETVALAGFLDSHYNALQVTIDRHYSKGVYIRGAYTWSKAIDLASDSAWSGATWMAPMFAGPGYLQHNRGMANFDRRHIFRIGYVWDLPFGAERKWANKSRVGRAVLGGWQLNGIWAAYSGTPTTIDSDPSLLPQSSNWQTMDQVGPIRKLGGLGPGTQWYDPSAFALVPTGPDGLQHRFGTTGRNIAVYGPGHWNWDASVFRHFKLTERFDLQFRAEALNVLNHPQWTWAEDERWGQGFCWTTATGACGGEFLQSPNAFGHRTIRLGLRLSF